MTNAYPRLRSHTRKRKSGKVVTYYFYDRRPEGEPDIPLGTDHTKALAKWDEIHNRLPRIKGTLQEAFYRWRLEVLPNYRAPTKRDYTQLLGAIEKVFGEATWDGIQLADLRDYLRKRSAKTRGNREMSLLSIVWNWARLEGLTKLHFPAAGLGRSQWKNKERPRRFEVTDELFAAVHADGDQVLRDCMDLASATGMRLTDCRTILLPKGELLRVEASKTGKSADFEIALSQVLPDLLARRRAIKTTTLMLLVTPDGRAVSAGMLRDRWDLARLRAGIRAKIANDDELADQIAAMWLRDMRKRAADLAESEDAAAELLQHSDKRLTRAHYRTKATRLKPVR